MQPHPPLPLTPPPTGDHHAVPAGSPDPYPDRAHVPHEVEKAFDHPEKVGHPDGVPHDVVGRVALSAVLLAGLAAISYFAFGLWIALTVGVVALWILFRGLPRQARKERTEEAFHDVDAVHHYGDPREAQVDEQVRANQAGSKDHV